LRFGPRFGVLLGMQCSLSLGLLARAAQGFFPLQLLLGLVRQVLARLVAALAVAAAAVTPAAALLVAAVALMPRLPRLRRLLRLALRLI